MQTEVQIDTTLDLTVSYDWQEAEPDVGIMHPHPTNICILHPVTKQPVHQDVYDVLSMYLNGKKTLTIEQEIMERIEP